MRILSTHKAYRIPWFPNDNHVLSDPAFPSTTVGLFNWITNFSVHSMHLFAWKTCRSMHPFAQKKLCYINAVMVLTQDFYHVNSLPHQRKESHPSCIKGSTRLVLCTLTWSQRRWSLRRGARRAFLQKQRLKQNMAGEHVRILVRLEIEMIVNSCCKFCCSKIWLLSI